MTVRNFLAIVELRTKVVSVSSCALGFLAVHADGRPLARFPPSSFIAALCVTWARPPSTPTTTGCGAR
jgi:hypothetical protein